MYLVYLYNRSKITVKNGENANDVIPILPFFPGDPGKISYIIESHGAWDLVFFPINPATSLPLRLFTYSDLGGVLTTNYKTENCPAVENTICGPLNGTDYSNVKEMYTGSVPNIQFSTTKGLESDKTWYPSITCCETKEKYRLKDVFNVEGRIDLYKIFSYLNSHALSMNPQPKVIQIFAFACLENKSPNYISVPKNVISLNQWPSHVEGDTLKRMTSAPGQQFWNNNTPPWSFNKFGKQSQLKKVIEEIKYLKLN